MVSIRCEDHGFDCDFVAQGGIEEVIFHYWKHMDEEHGIDYSKGTIGKFVTHGKTSSLNSSELIIDN